MIEFLHLLISVVVLAIILNGDCVTSRLSDDGSTCFGGPNSSTDSRIGYPFYSEYTNNTYVGYPGFLVNCEDDGRLTSNLSTTNLYSIQDIDYSGRTFTAVDVSLAGQLCPQPRHNFSAGGDNFYYLDENYDDNYNNDYSYVWMFYNCSSGYPEDTVQHLPCLDDSYNNETKMNTTSRGGRSFAFLEENIPQGYNWSQNCKENVRVRVRNYLIMESDYGQALRAGFQLKFVPNTEDCRNCEYNVGDGGGSCVHSKQTNAFVGCICPQRTKFGKNGVCTTAGDGYGTQQPNGTTTGAGYGTHQQKDGSRLSIRLKIIIGVSIGVGGLLLIVLLIYRSTVYSLYNSIVSWKNKIDRPTNVEAFLENYGSLSLQRYKYLDVKKMTNSFKETLGQGGYGTVYKGKLHDDCLVAVKVLNESKGNGEDFINEVAAIGRTNHVNVVSLLGFCTEGNKRALVYEFMSNGSLERFIYNNQQSSTTSTPLGWEKLYHIALGVARGLEYLHRGCNTRILHLDIKPHNILLDQNFCPKISDFGLAKLCPTLESVVSMVGARGTMGYIAPEVCCRHFGGVSHKSDVYSYGMMVLEMIGGRKNIDATVVNISQIYFPHWIYNHLEQGNKVHESEECDVEGSGETFENEKAKKMIIVALWCIQPQPTDRPSMRKVAEMLEGNIEELQMPPNPNMGTQSKYSPSP